MRRKLCSLAITNACGNPVTRAPLVEKRERGREEREQREKAPASLSTRERKLVLRVSDFTIRLKSYRTYTECSLIKSERKARTKFWRSVAR